MRVIVFDRELHEPLTVVEVPSWLAEKAKADPGQRIYIMPRPEAPRFFDPTAAVVTHEPVKAVSLTFEPVYRGRSSEVLFWYAYADDAELALLLRAAFLPGQVGEVRELEQRAYAKGVMRALFG